MKSSTYESIRFDRFVFAVLFHCASRVEQQKFDIDSDVEPPHVPNLMHTFFNITALMIGCILSCDTWRELTEAWWPLTAFSKWRFKLKHAETGSQAQNGRLSTCINTIYIFILYLFLNMIAISLNMNGTQQKKLIRLGAYKCSVNAQTRNGMKKMNRFIPLYQFIFIFSRGENSTCLLQKLDSAHNNNSNQFIKPFW